MTKILHLDTSGRHEGSVTRKLSSQIINAIKGDAQVTYRDIGKGIAFVDDTMIAGYFTPDDKRSAEQKRSLILSDTITKELFDHDVYVFGIPMYNFSMPATFKAWCDLAARAGVTFKFSEQGQPVGLLKGKKAYIVISSGGTPIGSEADFLTHWLRYFLNFLGIEDIDMICAADGAKIAEAEAYIAKLSQTP
jgi:FMN-dependent NADH-azoreductase